MSKEAAHALLNAAKLGQPVSEFRILQALQVTGDIGPGFRH